jgi:hypothetical protein
MAEIHAVACYSDLEAGAAVMSRVGLSDEHQVGRWVLRSHRGRMAHSPQEVGRAVAGEREDAVFELELFCDPDVSDQDLCQVRAAGFAVHRLTMQEIRDIPTWWYEAAQALYSDSHPLGGEPDRLPPRKG